MKLLLSILFFGFLVSICSQKEHPIDLHCDSVFFNDGSVQIMQVKEIKKNKLIYVLCCENCAVPRKLKLSDVDTIIYNQTITEKTFQETEGLIKATETHKKKNIVQLQLHPLSRWNFGTPAGYLEIDYERFFGKTKSWTFRVGIHPYFYNFRFDNSMFVVPLSFQKIINASKKNQFEFGFGVAGRIEPYEGKVYYDGYPIMIHLMYRNEINENWLFRAGATGYLTWGSTISPSIGMGYKF
jgi:hypothetical protein